MEEDPNDWKSTAFRMKAKQHIEEAIRQSGNPTNKTGPEMENHVFQRAKSREEYIGFLGRLILHITKYKQAGDPMNALQNMAGQQQQQQQPPQQQQPQQPQQLPPQMQQQQQQQQQPPQPPQDQAAMLSSMAARGQLLQPQPGAPMTALQMQQQQQQQQTAQQQRMQTQMMMQGGGQMSMLMHGGGPMARQPPPGQQAMMGPRAMAPSPGAMAAMAAKQQPSPAFMAPSPGGGLGHSPMAPGSNKVPSQMSAPSPQLHTPAAPANATPSPRNQHDETQYMEKVKQLSKYIEPIKRMIENTSHQDTAKLSKMKRLLDILENPSRQFPVDLLIKCEQVLEKLEINQHSDTAHAHSQQQHTTHKEYQVILDTVNGFSKSPYLNHTLGRTVGPPYQALLGCTLRLPPARRLRGPQRTPPADADPIPLALQREVAGMEARFKVTLDSTCPPGSCGGVRLVVELDEATAPSVPPIRLAVPSDYPARSPRCLHDRLAYSGTPFLRRVHQYLLSRLQKLPDHYTVSQLLHQWEMSVRQACAPPADAPSSPAAAAAAAAPVAAPPAAQAAPLTPAPAQVQAAAS